MRFWPKDKKWQKGAMIFLLLLGFFVFGALTVQAQVGTDFGVAQISEETVLGNQDIRVTIARIIRAILGLLGIITVVIVLYGGWVYMTAGGNEEKIATAKKILINGAIGLAIILSSFAITQFVLSKLAEATGLTGGGGGGGGGPTCYTLGTCPDPIGSCNYNFYIKSITPSTPDSGEVTNMNNIVVRAVFSQPISSATNVNEAITLTTTSGDQPTRDGNARLLDNNYVIEAEFQRTGTVLSDVVLDNGSVTDSADRWIVSGATASFSSATDASRDFTRMSGNLGDTVRYNIGKLTQDFYVADYSRLYLEVNPSLARFEFAVPIFYSATEFKTLIYSTEHNDYELDSSNSNIGYVPLDAVTIGSWNNILTVSLDNDFDQLFPSFASGKIGAVEIKMNGGVIGIDNLTLIHFPVAVADEARLSPGTYNVAVKEDILSAGGGRLQIGDIAGCGTFPSAARFNVNVERADIASPTVGSIEINGSTAEGQELAAGGTYNISANVNDDSGIGFVHLLVRKNDGSDLKNVYDGPAVLSGSSGVFNFSYDLVTPGLSPDLPATYTVTVTAYDIDHNFTSRSSNFILVGNHCANEVLDADETGVDCGGADCLTCGGGACNTDNDCAGWSRCLETATGKKCMAYPVILDVSPWSGAGDNFITVLGRNFGSTAGQVEFKPTDSTTWVSALRPNECSESGTWTDTYAIVKVPTSLVTPSDNVIRITDASSRADTTIDNFGPKEWVINNVENHGLFRKDNTVRPGLCPVTPESGLPNSDIIGTGTNFLAQDSMRIFFGGVQGSLESVTDGAPDRFTAKVPRNINPGLVGVYLQPNSGTGAERSNGVPFTVVSPTQVVNPTIGSIDPSQTTRLSYITVFGGGFGNVTGQLWMAKTKAELETCGQAGHTCLSLNVDLPDYCGDTWNDTQIIAQVPESADNANANYYVKVVNSLGRSAISGTFFTVIAGNPRASICSIAPAKGPAPLPATVNPIVLRGINFPDTNPLLYYWKQGAVASNVATWFDSVTANVTVTPCPDETETCVSTRLPGEIAGSATLPRGTNFIKIKGLDNNPSNAAIYEVDDCREAGAVPPAPGYACCQSGDEAGFWKVGTSVCAGESRTAGYAWRFSTGQIPLKPSVVEFCSNSTDPTEPQTVLPSPSPWASWAQGDNVCLNSSVIVRFNTSMDSTTFDNNSVQLRSCTATAEGLNCPTPITIPDITTNSYGSGVLTILSGNDASELLSPNTWYQVRLADTIESSVTTLVAGDEYTEHEPLSATRPCGDGSAYCFEFKTGAPGQLCTVTGAYINPPVFTTRSLGRIMDNGDELEYGVFGFGNQSCRVVDVSGLPWVWTSDGRFVDLVLSRLGESARDRQRADAKAPVMATDIVASAGNALEGGLVINPVTGMATIDILNKVVPRASSVAFRNADDIAELPDSLLNLYGLSTNSKLSLSFELDELTAAQMNNPIPNLYTAPRSLMAKSYNDTNNEYWFYVSDSIRTTYKERRFVFNFTPNPAGGSGYNLVYVRTISPTASWGVERYNFSVEFNEDGAFLYRDGVVVDSEPFTGGFVFNSIYNDLYVGSGGLELPDYYLFRGTVYDLTLEKVPSIYTETISATSILTIDLGDPRVIDYWPNCLEGCINTEIGAMFNTDMYYKPSQSIDSFSGNILVSKCFDSLCTSTTTSATFLEVDTDKSTPRKLVLRNSSIGDEDQEFLAQNQWYLVELNSNIKAVGGFDIDGNLLSGKPLEPFSWKFKTKDSGAMCIVDTVTVAPSSFVERIVGAKTMYSATPKGFPDSCSRRGQALDAWGYDWTWRSGDEDVAKVSNFESGSSRAGFCTANCLPEGSDIKKGDPALLCGNGILNSGEECDDPSDSYCTLNCLRTGNPEEGTELTEPVCGNSFVDRDNGEECDSPGSPYCSSRCLNVGSSPEFVGTDLTAPVCGDGVVSFGEDCDILDDTTKAGCSNNCLREGTPLASQWCEETDVSPLPAECNTAISVCGNGVVEPGEQCDTTANYCSDRCLITGNVCGRTTVPAGEAQYICNSSEAGCNFNCVKTGSSLSYPMPSICGDGAEGSGEYGECEVAGAAANRYGLPNQLVTAIGGGPLENVASQYQQTQIYAKTVGYRFLDAGATFPSTSEEEGSGTYYFQCGYKENESPTGLNNYNNCPGTDGDVDSVNRGVAENSCCYDRPARTDEYPIENSVGACLNTSIIVEFSGELDEATVRDNVMVAEREGGCFENDENDVSTLVAVETGEGESEPGFWSRVWSSVKGFFLGIFGQTAHATSHLAEWCTGTVRTESSVSYSETAGVKSTVVRLHLQQALSPETEYAVIFKGGTDGIKDIRGVGIRHQTASSGRLTDSWTFTTGEDICRLDKVNIEPASWTFDEPDQVKNFVGQAISTNNEQIESITGVYGWQWRWLPNGNPLFDIPADGSPSDQSNINIASNNLEGRLNAFGQITVQSDAFGTDEGKVVSGRTRLRAKFCNNIWPTRSSEFRDNDYNFSFEYCADAGVEGDTSDDLPFFTQGAVFSRPADASVLPAGTLRSYVFFSNKNDDALGVKILENPERLSATDWYKEAFRDAPVPTRVVIDGYDGVFDGNNLYVNAINTSPENNHRFFNNIYLFSISDDASDETRQVFDQIRASLLFNINIPDDASCMDGSETDPGVAIRRDVYSSVATTNIDCNNDFECRETNGTVKPGTNGTCANAKTKLQRDVTRVVAVQNIQNALTASGRTPSLSSGTYLPGYTNSKWVSWNQTLAQRELNALSIPADPLNDKKTTCSTPSGHREINQDSCWDEVDRTFYCPAYSSVYEYEFVEGPPDNYKLHAPLEYFGVLDDLVYEYVDINKFSDVPWCEGEPRSMFAGACGDGILQPGEDCDPPGKTRVTGCSVDGVDGNWSQVCSNSCSWQTPVGAECKPNIDCGNGEREGLEACDDGELNGTYNRCNASCTGWSNFCGNNQLDRIAGVPVEFCDTGASGVCEYISEAGVTTKPSVYIVLDRSISMNTCDGQSVGGGYPDCEPYTNSLWEQAKSGIDKVVEDMGSLVNFAGIRFFSGLNKTPKVCSFEQSISGSINWSTVGTPSGPTPTKDALLAVLTERERIFGSDSSVPKFVILITDGEPNNTDECFGNTVGSVKSTLENLLEAGVQTYVIGFGSLTDDLKGNLNQFANAGGTDTYYQAENSAELIESVQDALSCTPYNFFQVASCANDCQGYGRYCGDGRTDWSNGETCDDGNDIDNDDCHNNCTANEDPFVDPTPVPGTCGDGEVNTGEECDAGTNNGITCTPTYGGSNCTYCANDCRVLTVDAPRCGNGVLEVDQNSGTVEGCDVKSDGTIIGLGGNPTGLSCTAPQVGSYSCSSDCLTATSGCFDCGLVQASLLAPFAEPRFALLNPMVGKNVSGDGGWRLSTSIHLKSSTGSTLAFTGTPSYLNYDYTTPRTFSSLPTGNTAVNKLVSSNLCVDKYAVYFNGFINRLFPYPVNNQYGFIDNEYIVSPAVPKGVFRVVVRWSDTENSRDVRFGATVFSQYGNKDIVGFTEAIAHDPSGRSGICNEMQNLGFTNDNYTDGRDHKNYWWPSNCFAFNNTSMYVHDMGGLKKTFAHSLTIDTNAITETDIDDSRLAVFVQAFSAESTDSTIISSFVDSENLKVDVYSFDTINTLLDPLKNILPPDDTFSITGAKNTSTSPTARYWHVFNLVRNAEGKYEIETVNNVNTDSTFTPAPDGSIELRFCDLQRNVGIENACPTP